MWFSEHTGNRMGRITPDGTITEFADPDAEQHAARDRARRRRQHLVRRVCGRKDRSHHAAGVITEFPIPTPDSGPRALAAGPDGNIWFSEFNASKIGRITPAA